MIINSPLGSQYLFRIFGRTVFDPAPEGHTALLDSSRMYLFIMDLPISGEEKLIGFHLNFETRRLIEETKEAIQFRHKKRQV